MHLDQQVVGWEDADSQIGGGHAGRPAEHLVSCIRRISRAQHLSSLGFRVFRD